MEIFPWNGNIPEILWKYSVNKTSVLWKRSSFSSGILWKSLGVEWGLHHSPPPHPPKTTTTPLHPIAPTVLLRGAVLTTHSPKLATTMTSSTMNSWQGFTVDLQRWISCINIKAKRPKSAPEAPTCQEKGTVSISLKTPHASVFELRPATYQNESEWELDSEWVSELKSKWERVKWVRERVEVSARGELVSACVRAWVSACVCVCVCVCEWGREWGRVWVRVWVSACVSARASYWVSE